MLLLVPNLGGDDRDVRQSQSEDQPNRDHEADERILANKVDGDEDNCQQ